MTKSQRIKILHRAAEMIATGEEWWSCHAVSIAEMGDELWFRSPLSEEYARFYDQRSSGSWDMGSLVSREEAINCRILMILLFAEVGLEGVRE